MKKSFIILLVLLISFSQYAYAVDESDFLGTWIRIVDTDNFYLFNYFHLFPDHTAFYQLKRVQDNSIVIDQDQIITWSLEDDVVQLFVNNDYIKSLCIDQEGDLVDIKPYHDKYKKIYPVSKDQNGQAGPTTSVPGNLTEGFLLDPGQYIIGEDLPEGDYRFEYYKAPVDIFVHKDPDSAFWSAFASVSDNSPVYAKLHLPDGARLDIIAFPVIIMYAKKLNLGE